MSDTDEQEAPEPMHPAVKKFLEEVFRDVCVEGITRRLEFIEDGDGNTTVKLVASNDVLPAVHLGFPAGWWAPSPEEWNEALREEVSGEDYSEGCDNPDCDCHHYPVSDEQLADYDEEYEQALEHENDLRPEELAAECAVIHPGHPHVD